MNPPAAPVLVCTICQCPFEPGNEPVACPSCSALYHADCWAENGGCGVYGCKQSPEVKPRGDMEIPAGYWGQQHKQCPVCRAEIAAAAVRCRQCGTTFDTATPVDVESFRNKAKKDAALPAAKKQAIIIFALCIVTCTAPIGVVYGVFWWATHRATVRTLPSLHNALCKIGIGVGVLQILAIAIFCFIHAQTQSHPF